MARIECVEKNQQQRALELVLANEHLPDQDVVSEAAQFAGRKDISLEGLFGLLRGHCLVGAVWALVTPGRTALVWPAKLQPGEDEASAQRLHQAVDHFLRDQKVSLAQSLQMLDHGLAAQRLTAAGFSHASDVLYLGCSTEQFPGQRPDCDFELESIADIDTAQIKTPGKIKTAAESESILKRLGRVIERSYEQSLDFPQLDGARKIADVITGYQRTGVYCPHLWLIAKHEGKDIGCLLIADHPASGHCELVYMGLIGEVRGRRWGRQLIRYGQWMTRLQTRGQMVLGVDAANHPAIAAYSATGFRMWDRRSVFVKVYRGLFATFCPSG